MRTSILKCPRCGSKKIKLNSQKYMLRGLVKIFYCVICGRTFTEPRKHVHMRFGDNLVDYVLRRLKDKKTPLRQIAAEVYEKFKVKISHSAIYHWAHKFNIRERNPAYSRHRKFLPLLTPKRYVLYSILGQHNSKQILRKEITSDKEGILQFLTNPQFPHIRNIRKRSLIKCTAKPMS